MPSEPITAKQVELLLEAVGLRQEWEEREYGRPWNRRPAVQHELLRLKEALKSADEVIIKPR